MNAKLFMNYYNARGSFPIICEPWNWSANVMCSVTYNLH
jgi:hypothetical protein